MIKNMQAGANLTKFSAVLLPSRDPELALRNSEVSYMYRVAFAICFSRLMRSSDIFLDYTYNNYLLTRV